MVCLMERESSGIVVKLWEQDGEVTVTVKDEKTGDNFVVTPDPSKALDAYYHPFAYRSEEGDGQTRDYA